MSIFHEKFLTNFEQYRDSVLKSSKPSDHSKRIIDPNVFFKTYVNTLGKINSEHNKIAFLTNSNIFETRVLHLIESLHDSNIKFMYHQQNPNMNYNPSNTSDWIKVNEVIKKSRELTSYLYWIQWIQKNMKNYFQNNYFSGQNVYKCLEHESVNKMNFHYDTLNNNMSNNEYSNWINQIITFTWKGNYAEAQELAEMNRQLYMSAAFEGGWPYHDPVIHEQIDNNFDPELLPPYMKNKELKECWLNSDNLGNIIGNSDWTLWLSTIYDSAWTNTNNAPFNFLCRCISGNSLNFNLSKSKIDEYLFINIMRLFNTTLLEVLKGNDMENPEYKYKCDPQYASCSSMNRNGETIFSWLDSIRNSPEYQIICKINYTWDLELSLIELHFLQNTNHNNYYIKLSKTLDNILEHIDSNVIRSKINDIINSSVNNSSGRWLSEIKDKCGRDSQLVEISYHKIIFSMLISVYSTNISVFNSLNASEFKEWNDSFLIRYIRSLLDITNNPRHIVYITAYMFSMANIKLILKELSSTLQKGKEFEVLTEEICRFFNVDEQNEINKVIADNTAIFSFDKKAKTIDEVLDEYIDRKKNNTPQIISESDKNKIEQVYYLFCNRDYNPEIAHKNIIKLAFKFCSHHQYHELLLMVTETFGSVFNSSLSNCSNWFEILGKLEGNLQNNNMWNEAEWEALMIETSFSLIKIIIHCFYNFHDIKYNYKYNTSGWATKTRENLNTTAKEFLDGILIKLNKLLKLIACYSNLWRTYINVFDDGEVKEDWKNIISDWGFQTIKWCVDLFRNKYISDRNIGLRRVEDCIVFNDDMFSNYYLVGKTFGELNNESIKNNTSDFVEMENRFYGVMEKGYKEQILGLVYEVEKINQEYLQEVMDNGMMEGLSKDIDELDF